MISGIQKSETKRSNDQEGLSDNFGISKEEFKIEVIRDGKVEKTLENEKVDFSKLKDIFNKIEDERFI